MKVVIVGGVAGGASAAARIRRLSEQAEIVMLERGAEPSFANCGLPYYVGGVITERNKLLVAPKSRLVERYRIDVRVRSEVMSLDRAAKTVEVRELDTNRRYTESYDRLVLAPGATPFRPPIPGIDHPKILTLRDLQDADRLAAVATTSRSALIVGAGFIGIEMAENLVHRGLEVTLVELVDQILPPWDKEMTTVLTQHLRQKGVRLLLGDSASEFSSNGSQITTRLQSDVTLTTDFAVLCIGVRPENRLAQAAGLECGARGGIRTNRHMQTSDPHIYAVGDAVEVVEFVSGQPSQIPLAGPANRQGRIAADHIFGRDSAFRGTQGTAVVGLFGMTAAMTGLSEKLLQRMQRPYHKVYLHPANHAGYYPGARQLSLKLLFDPLDGKILGGQAVGWDGVDKRIDGLALAIQAGITVFDLEEAELCYAPQYGSAKDPLNMAGFIASGVLRGDHPIVHVDQLSGRPTGEHYLLDVRTTAEFQAGHIPGAHHIPIDELRVRLAELPKNQTIIAYCQVGMRGYLATRILLQNGFPAANLSGGYTTWMQWNVNE
jgi:NADPH-dependent 2,4-dienoyl-CoA reductase/sulfur reductase-like enzyme/rhodanese-related sulfurtransferase